MDVEHTIPDVTDDSVLRGGTEFGNVIVVKSKDKHGRCFPCYLFIEGLSLCQSLWILLTQIFLVEVKEKL